MAMEGRGFAPAVAAGVPTTKKKIGRYVVVNVDAIVCEAWKMICKYMRQAAHTVERRRTNVLSAGERRRCSRT
jgi:hypothetical protein